MLVGGCTDNPDTGISDGCGSASVVAGSVLMYPAERVDRSETVWIWAGRLLDGLLTSDPTAFITPGKLCGDILPTNPSPSTTVLEFAVWGLRFATPTVENGVDCLGNAVEDFENGVGEIVRVLHDGWAHGWFVRVLADVWVCLMLVGVQRKPSEGQSTTRLQVLRSG